MATSKTTSIQKLRKRAAKKVRKLSKNARKLAMRARAVADGPVSKKGKSGKGKKAHRTGVPG
jgi:hypothetical protein